MLMTRQSVIEKGGGGWTCNITNHFVCCSSGYTNEVGEAFRAQVPVRLVHLSYVAASGYVVADAVQKGWEASQVMCKKGSKRQTDKWINRPKSKQRERGRERDACRNRKLVLKVYIYIGFFFYMFILLTTTNFFYHWYLKYSIHMEEKVFVYL